MTYVDLMWNALAGGLGQEKTAYLKNRPLHHIVRDKIAHDHGVDVGDQMTLGDAIGTLGISWRKKKAQHRVVNEGLQALRAVLPKQAEKTASENSQRLYPRDASTFQKIATAHKLRILEPMAQGEEAEKIAELRCDVDEDIMESLKKEARLSAVAKHPAARNIGKGLALGAGAAVPLGAGGYMAGSALSDRFTSDARDKALETAAGVGAIGTGVYGLGKAIDHGFTNREMQNKARMAQRLADDAPVDWQFAGKVNNHRTGNSQRIYTADGSLDAENPDHQALMLQAHKKTGSVSSSDTQNFKTAVYIDALLEEAPQNEKVAEVRQLNREYAVNLLCDAHVKEAQASKTPNKGQDWISHEGFEAFDPLTYFDKEAQQVGVPVDRATTGLEKGLLRATAGLGGAGLGGGLGALSSSLTGADPLKSALIGASIGGLGGALVPPPQSQPSMLTGTPEELMPLFEEQPGDESLPPEERQRIESIRNMLIGMQQ